jgi:hypothetical protein
MSLQAAQDFIDRANQDQVIRKLARDRFGEIEAVGREHGYDFERDELDQAMRERRATQHPLMAGPEGGPSGGRDSDFEDPTGTNCQCGPTGGVSSDFEDPTGTNCQCGPASSSDLQ